MSLNQLSSGSAAISGLTLEQMMEILNQIDIDNTKMMGEMANMQQATGVAQQQCSNLVGQQTKDQYYAQGMFQIAGGVVSGGLTLGSDYIGIGNENSGLASPSTLDEAASNLENAPQQRLNLERQGAQNVNQPMGDDEELELNLQPREAIEEQDNDNGQNNNGQLRRNDAEKDIEDADATRTEKQADNLRQRATDKRARLQNYIHQLESIITAIGQLRGADKAKEAKESEGDLAATQVASQLQSQYSQTLQSMEQWAQSLKSQALQILSQAISANTSAA